MNKYLPSTLDFDSPYNVDDVDHDQHLFFEKNSKKIAIFFNYSPKISLYIEKINKANNFLKAILDVSVEQAYEVLLFPAAKKFFPGLNNGTNNKLDNKNFALKFNVLRDFSSIKAIMASNLCLAILYLIPALIYLSIKLSLIAFKILTTLQKLLISSLLLAIDLVAHVIVNIPKFLEYCKKKKDAADREFVLKFSISTVPSPNNPETEISDDTKTPYNDYYKI